jgi:hypothetical protein
MDPEERRKRMQERMASMSPEEREQFAQRLRERGIDPATMQGGPGGGPGGAPGGGRAGAARTGSNSQPATGQSGRRTDIGSAQTIDSLFGPLPQAESFGRVWLFMNNQLKPVRLRLGVSDGTYSEVLSGEIEPNAEVVTAVTLAAESAASTPGRSPLMGPQRPGPPGGGPPGGGAPAGGARPSGR